MFPNDDGVDVIPLTSTEIELLVEALRWKKRYEDCNPEVGFGTSLDNMLTGIANKCYIDLSDEDRELVLDLYNARYRR